MNLKTKLTFLFSYQFIVLFIVISVVVIGSIFYIGDKEQRLLADSSFTLFREDDFLTIFSFFNREIQVKPHYEQSVLRQNGWLQIIDENGEEVYALNTPDYISNTYSKTDMYDLLLNRSHEITSWIVPHYDDDYIILFGYHHELKDLQAMVIEEKESILANQQVSVELRHKFDHHDGKLYVINEHDEVVMHYPKTAKEFSYSITTLSRMQKKPWNYQDRHIILYDDDLKHTFIIEVPNTHYHPENYILNLFGYTILSLFIILIVAAFWYARKFGKPMLHIIEWVKQIANGTYEEPKNKKGESVSKMPSGELKRSFRTFKEVLDALNHLMLTLKQSESDRIQADHRREEWISGLTHDLKTPLSSVYGYAVMLESEKYDWTPKDVRAFGKIMREKTDYMSSLIDDLNLTYRLKNDALPLSKESVNVNAFVKGVIKQFKEQPFITKQQINVNDSAETIIYELDKKYFKRMLDNILANAIKYNREDTKIQLDVIIRSSGFAIRISDNGVGMDEEKVSQLFERYYRGVNTDAEIEGTGLGLAITKQLVHAHHGKIDVQSTIGEGTTIILTFEGKSKSQ